MKIQKLTAVTLTSLIILGGAKVTDAQVVSEAVVIPQPGEAALNTREWAKAMQSWVAKPTPSRQLAQVTVGQITGVEVKPTETGLQIIFTVPGGGDFQILTTREKNTLTATIQNAQLALPDGGTFARDNPTPDITKITIAPGENNTVQISVLGNAGAPTVQFQQQEGQLIAGLTPTTQPPVAPETEQVKPEAIPTIEEDELRIVVTGDRTAGYFVPNSTTIKGDIPILGSAM